MRFPLSLSNGTPPSVSAQPLLFSLLRQSLRSEEGMQNEESRITTMIELTHARRQEGPEVNQ